MMKLARRLKKGPHTLPLPNPIALPTMPTAMPPAAHRAPTLALLLARYIAGEIAEAHLFGLSDLFDDADASAEERTAFARFYLDALVADGEVSLPQSEELIALLALARA